MLIGSIPWKEKKIAKKLNDALKQKDGKIQVLIQVNIDQEHPSQASTPIMLLDFKIIVDAKYTNLILKGLMFMPKINQSKKDKIDSMKKITALQSTFINEFPACNVLSLGTSNDFEESILAGSTMIRIGVERVCWVDGHECMFCWMWQHCASNN